MKAFFLTRAFREKLLLTALLVLAAATWLATIAHRGHRLWISWRATATQLATQQQWINNRPAVEKAAAQAAAHLDPARTFSSTRLLGELSTIAQQVGLRNNTSSEILGTERSGQFAVNTVQFALRNTDWAALKQFYLELSKRAPYIGIEQFDASVNPGNPHLLNVVLKISSVQIVQ